MRSRMVRLIVLLALLTVAPAAFGQDAAASIGDNPMDALSAVDALMMGNDPLDPYDDPPPANTFGVHGAVDDEEDASIGEDEIVDPVNLVAPVDGVKVDVQHEKKEKKEIDVSPDDVEDVADVVDDLDPESGDDVDYAVELDLDYDDLNLSLKRRREEEEEEWDEDGEEEDLGEEEVDEEFQDSFDEEPAHEHVEKHISKPKQHVEHKHKQHAEEPKKEPEVVIPIVSDSRCGPGAKVDIPVYKISPKTATKAPKRVEADFERAKSIHRVESFEADDPKRADVIWTFASLGNIPVSSTAVDPDVSAPMRERTGRLKSIGNSVSHLRAVAAAFDAGDEHVLILEDHQGNDFEAEWANDLSKYIETLPKDWQVINLAAYFAETEDVYELVYEADAKSGKHTVAIPKRADTKKHEMREWVTAWDAAGRPSVMPRPYHVAPDERLAHIHGGVAAHRGASAWLMNRDGMRAILKQYRRPDGSIHLDGATCTEYDACVIGEVFRKTGGIYEATPPLFVQKPGAEQLRRFDTTADVNDVLEMFRAFTKDWLAFVGGSKNGFLEHAEGKTAAGKGKTSKSHRKASLGAASSVTPTDTVSENLVKSHEMKIIEAAAIAAGAADANADDKGVAANVQYGYKEERQVTAAEKEQLAREAAKEQAEKEVSDELEETKNRADAMSNGIDWKAMRNTDYGEEAFYGEPIKREKREYKYLDAAEAAPMYDSIEEADAAFVAAQQKKEVDERERAAEEKAGREAKTKEEKENEQGDGHWHSKRGRGGVALDVALEANKDPNAVGAIGLRPARHHIHFDDEPEVVEEVHFVAAADPNAVSFDTHDDTAVGAIGMKPGRRSSHTKSDKKHSVKKQSTEPHVARAGHSHHKSTKPTVAHAGHVSTTHVPSVVDKDGFECLVPSGKQARLGAAPRKFSFPVFDELSEKDEAKTAALGAARVRFSAAAFVVAVAGAFVVTMRAQRKAVASAQERLPLLAQEC